MRLEKPITRQIGRKILQACGEISGRGIRYWRRAGSQISRVLRPKESKVADGMIHASPEPRTSARIKPAYASWASAPCAAILDIRERAAKIHRVSRLPATNARPESIIKRRVWPSDGARNKVKIASSA